MGAAKAHLRAEHFVHGSNCRLATVMLPFAIHPRLCKNIGLMPIGKAVASVVWSLVLWHGADVQLCHNAWLQRASPLG